MQVRCRQVINYSNYLVSWTFNAFVSELVVCVNKAQLRFETELVHCCNQTVKKLLCGLHVVVDLTVMNLTAAHCWMLPANTQLHSPASAALAAPVAVMTSVSPEASC